METFKKLLFLLNSHERKRLALLLIMITIGALLDMIGVASILPFMAVLTNPGLITSFKRAILPQHQPMPVVPLQVAPPSPNLNCASARECKAQNG